MATTQPVAQAILPDEIARKIVLPEGHADLDSLHAAYRWMRQNMPVGKAVVDGFDELWLVAKHADILQVEGMPEVFAAGGGPDHPGSHNPILQNQAGDQFMKNTVGTVRIMDALPYMDGAEHSAMKAIAFDYFKPSRVAKLEDQIRQLARASIDKLKKVSEQGEIDLVTDWALGFPLHVIMSLFGVPPEDEPLMMKLTQEFFGTADPEHQRDDIEAMTPEAMAQQFVASFQEFCGYFENLLQDRRANPRDDLATIIAQARRADGEYWPASFAYGWFMQVCTAGHDTTSSTLAGTLKALAEHPDVLARVKADLSLVPKMVVEGVRYVAPVKHFMRIALTDTTLGGQTIKAGERVMPLFQSGCRDEDLFENPDVFSLDRENNSHLGFGFGPHTCVGQHLAKLELRIMFEELLPRLESIEITGPGSLTATNFVGGLKHLPARVKIS